MINRIKTSQKETGFTLVELLVVILIIGILAAVATPAFLAQRQRANDAATISDVKNIATIVHEAEIDCPDGDRYYFGAGTGGAALNQVSWTGPNGNVVGPISPNTHTITYDYTQSNTTRARINEGNTMCAASGPISLSEGTILHLTYFGDTSGGGSKTGHFHLYGWNPNGKDYNGAPVDFSSNIGQFPEEWMDDVVVYDSLEGGIVN